MSKKIATVSTVFAACDRLEAGKGRWNRDDVRSEIGGGGYVVIDPLIRAWRELKPLREASPTTPAELLHQVAVSLEAHIADFNGAAEARLRESQQVFDATVEELSAKLVERDAELMDKAEALQAADTATLELSDALESARQDLQAACLENARLTTEADGLRGQVARLENEHQQAVQALQSENKTLTKQHAEGLSRLADEHTCALAHQRTELAESAEQAENRLMMLLDQARQEAKAAALKLSDDLAAMTQQAQSGRETIAVLETRSKELDRQKRALESELSKEETSRSEVQIALEAERARSESIAREFDAYKKEHNMSNDLGALQTAVTALQAQLQNRDAQSEG